MCISTFLNLTPRLLLLAEPSSPWSCAKSLPRWNSSHLWTYKATHEGMQLVILSWGPTDHSRSLYRRTSHLTEFYPWSNLQKGINNGAWEFLPVNAIDMSIPNTRLTPRAVSVVATSSKRDSFNGLAPNFMRVDNSVKRVGVFWSWLLFGIKTVNSWYNCSDTCIVCFYPGILWVLLMI